MSSSNAPSLLSPTAKPGTATPTSLRCRCAPSSAPPTTMRGASWSAMGPRSNCDRAVRTAAPRACWVAGGCEARMAGGGRGEPVTSPLGVVAGDTCHVDVVDRWGNMVSATPSGGWLQSSPVIPELGFCLGTRAQMFWLEEGLPASLAPGKRPRSTLSPSMAFRDGEPYLAFGTPGGGQPDAR